jgi:hypothetical protein
MSWSPRPAAPPSLKPAAGSPGSSFDRRAVIRLHPTGVTRAPERIPRCYHCAALRCSQPTKLSSEPAPLSTPFRFWLARIECALAPLDRSARPPARDLRRPACTHPTEPFAAPPEPSAGPPIPAESPAGRFSPLPSFAYPTARRVPTPGGSRLRRVTCARARGHREDGDSLGARVPHAYSGAARWRFFERRAMSAPQDGIPRAISAGGGAK